MDGESRESTQEEDVMTDDHRKSRVGAGEILWDEVDGVKEKD